MGIVVGTLRVPSTYTAKSVHLKSHDFSYGLGRYFANTSTSVSRKHAAACSGDTGLM